MSATRSAEPLDPPRARLRAGIRRGVPFGIAVFAISVSYAAGRRPGPRSP